jgi:hypothetical protein
MAGGGDGLAEDVDVPGGATGPRIAGPAPGSDAADAAGVDSDGVAGVTDVDADGRAAGPDVAAGTAARGVGGPAGGADVAGGTPDGRGGRAS